jgi:ubiquinone/menaquinone biosynthesis C-methylase UbiE
MLARTLEPEVMDTAQEAADYDAMDHSEVNARFCEDFLATLSRPVMRVLDVGTGTALIPIELCRRAPAVRVDALDLGTHMLGRARINVERAGLTARIHLAQRDAKATGEPEGAFDGVISNSIVHHIPDPSDVLREMLRLVARGGVLFVRDLVRPETEGALDGLVVTYAAIPAGLDAPAREMHERQRDLFAASLRAALSVDEVRATVTPLGIPAECVRATSDRHWTLGHVKP